MCVLKSVDSNDLWKKRCFVFSFLRIGQAQAKIYGAHFRHPQNSFLFCLFVCFVTMCDYKGVSWAKVMKTDVNFHPEFEKNL